MTSVFFALLGGAIAVLFGSVTALAQGCTDLDVPATTVATAPPFINPNHMDAVNRLLSKRAEVVAFGDSIMQGWPVDRLRKAFGATDVVNAGFGEDGTQNTLWRLDHLSLTGQAPRFVIVLLGTNNMTQSVCDIYAGEMAVLHRLRQLFPRAQIIFTSVLPRGPQFYDHDDKIRSLNELLSKASVPQHFLFFNVHDEFLCDHQPTCSLYQKGNLHLTLVGYDLLIGNLERFIAKQSHDP